MAFSSFFCALPAFNLVGRDRGGIYISEACTDPFSSFVWTGPTAGPTAFPWETIGAGYGPAYSLDCSEMAGKGQSS